MRYFLIRFSIIVLTFALLYAFLFAGLHTLKSTIVGFDYNDCVQGLSYMTDREDVARLSCLKQEMDLKRLEDK